MAVLMATELRSASKVQACYLSPSEQSIKHNPVMRLKRYLNQKIWGPSNYFYPTILFISATFSLMGCGQNPAPQTEKKSPSNEYKKDLPHIRFLNPKDDHMLRLDLIQGKSFFQKPWVFSPASTLLRDGLGPHFNEKACSSCHPGHGPAPMQDSFPKGMVIQMSLDHQKSHPLFGTQLQTKAHPRLSPEAILRMDWQAVSLTPNIQLRKPKVIFQPELEKELKNSRLTLRRAPSVIGMGVIDAISNKSILANADPNDSNHDGISGRVNSWTQGNTLVMGKFGWKATESTLRQQTAKAFVQDMGITNPLFPEEENPDFETGVVEKNPDLDIDENGLGQVVTYLKSLTWIKHEDYRSHAGFPIFQKMGCAACHLPQLEDLSSTPLFSDLLLHDMGEGLQDGKPDRAASGREWRTAPLWGLRRKLIYAEVYLHDGRAQNLKEAILWHGGEAKISQQKFLKASLSDQSSLIIFLKSL
jgi:CxxC motif-containing protein (DUF1111 family)